MSGKFKNDCMKSISPILLIGSVFLISSNISFAESLTPREVLQLNVSPDVRSAPVNNSEIGLPNLLEVDKDAYGRPVRGCMRVAPAIPRALTRTEYLESVALAKKLDKPHWKPYELNLVRRIKAEWFPPNDLEKKRVIVIFVITPSGEIREVRIGTSSGNALADDAARKAVENAAPFGKAPVGVISPQGWQFTFGDDSLGRSMGAVRRPPHGVLPSEL